MEPRIWLAEDNRAIRDSLSLVFSCAGWKTHVFDSARPFRHHDVELRHPGGCMRLDIRMPGRKRVEAVGGTGSGGVSLTVIIITGHDDSDWCRRAFKSGAFEFLTWPVDADLLFEIFSAAREIYKGQSEIRKKWQPQEEKPATLITREKEMLEHLGQGYSSKEIAQRHSLSLRTVEAHRASIFSKTGVNSLPELRKIYRDTAKKPK